MHVQTPDPLSYVPTQKQSPEAPTLSLDDQPSDSDGLVMLDSASSCPTDTPSLSSDSNPLGNAAPPSLTQGSPATEPNSESSSDTTSYVPSHLRPRIKERWVINPKFADLQNTSSQV